MENSPSEPINPVDQETSDKSGLIQQALDFGRSLLNAYTTRGFQIVQEVDDHRTLYLPEKSRVLSAPRLAFADWDKVNYPGGTRIAEQQLAKSGIFEVAILVPLTKEITALKKTIDKPGFLGIGRKTHQEPYVLGSQPVTIGEAKDGEAGGEPAVALYYYAGDYVRGKGLAHSKSSFFDAGGRPGNNLYAEIVLPQSLYGLLADHIKENSRFVRDLINAFVRQRYSHGFVESWDKYARPPYREWDERPAAERKFYFADLVKNPQSKKIPLTQAIEQAQSY